jgi:hypothetical protein
MGRQIVDHRRFNDGVSGAVQGIEALVIGQQKQDIGLTRRLPFCRKPGLHTPSGHRGY